MYHGVFRYVPWSVWVCSMECLGMYHGVFRYVPWSV